MPSFNLTSFSKTLPETSGVYQMFNQHGEILYVGKAKNLKKRISSYLRKTSLNSKSKTLIEKTARIEITVTSNEKEALLLENSLIKYFLPKFNVIFKDDKSYPYLHLSRHKFPRLTIKRGVKKCDGDVFGPYPSVSLVQEILPLLSKIFLVRFCADAFYRYRTRPCLQYQIKRCSAPCVNYITEENYRHNVDLLMKFLRGKNREVIRILTDQMAKASREKKYELAARYRDQIASLEHLQLFQCVVKDKGDLDLIVLVEQHGIKNLTIVFIRSGAVISCRTYFPITSEFYNDTDLITLFLENHHSDFIERYGRPQKIVSNIDFPKEVSSELFDIPITKAKSGKVLAWSKFATNNALDAISRLRDFELNFLERFKLLENSLHFSRSLNRIECFDVSHIQGKYAVASRVVFTRKGPLKSSYRKFNLRNIKACDDCGALREVLFRRFYRKEMLPELLLIDGGKGQLNIAYAVLKKFNLFNGVVLIAIAKDKRKKNNDILYRIENERLLRVYFPPIVLHFLQAIRDEAHRFAVSSHRRRREKID